jgi:hypothetical protein
VIHCQGEQAAVAKRTLQRSRIGGNHGAHLLHIAERDSSSNGHLRAVIEQ